MRSIALMMEAAHTSETSVDNYFTRQYIPEDKSELQLIQLFAFGVYSWCYLNYYDVRECRTARLP
jgi:hypothetical protein